MGGCFSAPKEEEPSTDITEKPPPRRSSIKLATAEALSTAVQQTLPMPHVHRKTSTGGGEFTAAELAAMRAKHERKAPKEKRPSMVHALTILKSKTWYTDEYATVDRPEWANEFIELLQKKALDEMAGTDDDNTAFLMVVAAMKIRFVELKDLLSAAPSSSHVDPKKAAAIKEIVDMQNAILEDFHLLPGGSAKRKVNIAEFQLRSLWYRKDKGWMEDDGLTYTDPTAEGVPHLVQYNGKSHFGRKGGGEWKEAETPVLKNVEDMIIRWGDDDLERFVEKHKTEMCPEPKLPGAHSIYYNELESLFDDAGNYEDRAANALYPYDDYGDYHNYRSYRPFISGHGGYESGVPSTMVLSMVIMVIFCVFCMLVCCGISIVGWIGCVLFGMEGQKKKVRKQRIHNIEIDMQNASD